MAIGSGARVTVEPPSIQFSQVQRRRVGRILALEKAKKLKSRMEKEEKGRAASKLEKKAEIERKKKERKEEMKREEEKKMRLYAEVKERKEKQAQRCIKLKKLSRAKREALLIEQERDCELKEGAEHLCSFTVMWPRYDWAFPYHRSRIGEPTPQKLSSLFMGLGVSCAVRFVDSPRFAFTVSVPGRGLVLIHRQIDRFCDLALDDDFVFQTVCRAFYGIAKQLWLSPASLLAIQPPKEAASLLAIQPPKEAVSLLAKEAAPIMTHETCTEEEEGKERRRKASRSNSKNQNGKRRRRKERRRKANRSKDENEKRRRKERRRKANCSKYANEKRRSRRRRKERRRRKANCSNDENEKK